jgi:hypothetical protein
MRQLQRDRPTIMSLAAEPPQPGEVSHLEVVDLDPGNQSGRETFSKYRYQAKLTLSHWLTTLLPDGPVRIYSEHQEDIVIEHVGNVRFAQVKTRNPGLSRWTLTAIVKDGGGLDSLLRCYRQTGHLANCSYELLLEGEPSDRTPSAEFFDAPEDADKSVRRMITETLEAQPGEIDILLSRLIIRPGQISRANIDDRNLVALFKMLQTVPYPVIQETYDKLLMFVENLQSGEKRAEWWTEVGRTIARDDPAIPFLSADQLRALLPKVPTASPTEWHKLLSDPTLSDLERKLILAGGDKDDIREAKELRAIALPRIRELASGPDTLFEAYDRTCTSLLRYAKGVARTHHGKASGAKHVLGDIIRAADSEMRTYDQQNLFAEHFALAGVVCEISDECRFGWQ